MKLQATEKDIKTAYRKLALTHHPDKKLGDILAKIGEEQKQEGFDVKEHPEYHKMEYFWHKIQNAYETLIDPEKRFKYDSTLPFDDSVPSESEEVDDDNFFDV